jgi:hypothetical protein
MSEADRALVARVVEDSPRELDPKQEEALAIALRRRPEAIRDAIASAREELQLRASRYGQIHAEAVEKALAKDDPISLGIAAKESRVMLERLADDSGARVIDAEKQQPGNGLTVQIGIAMGGMQPPKGNK